MRMHEADIKDGVHTRVYCILQFDARLNLALCTSTPCIVQDSSCNCPDPWYLSRLSIEKGGLQALFTNRVTNCP